VLGLKDLTVRYRRRRGQLTAVDSVSLEVPASGILGVVGESGSGKSSLARGIVGLAPATGTLRLDGVEYRLGERATLRVVRQSVQMVFQNHASTLNPRMTVQATLREAIKIHARGIGRREAAREAARLLDLVLLEPEAMWKFPHEFSGGQRQRIAIARALATRPRVLIADEITSGLDVSVQATVLNVLRGLQETLGLSCILITHDLAVARFLSGSIAVMYLGRVIECAETDELFAFPAHPYTRGLIASGIEGVSSSSGAPLGEPADIRQPPAGCRFHPRCTEGPMVIPERSLCYVSDPQEQAEGRTHRTACHFAATEPSTAHRLDDSRRERITTRSASLKANDCD
jgi:peptide/nickel transport system ATP-binding protein